MARVAPVPQSGDTGRAMSQDNVETVRRLYSLKLDAGGVARGDYDELFLNYIHPDFEFVPPSTYPDSASSYRGQDGLRGWYRSDG